MASKTIRQLLSVPGLRIQCPYTACGEEFAITKAKLFSMYDSYPPTVRKIIRGRFDSADQLEEEIKERKRELAENKQTKPEKIKAAAQGSNFGKIAEQIVPAFVTFPYKQNECRPLFEPIDYVIFAGLAAKGRVEGIKFVDVKAGDAGLSKRQREIRDCISQGRIKHKVIG